MPDRQAAGISPDDSWRAGEEPGRGARSDQPGGSVTVEARAYVQRFESGTYADAVAMQCSRIRRRVAQAAEYREKKEEQVSGSQRDAFLAPEASESDPTAAP